MNPEVEQKHNFHLRGRMDVIFIHIPRTGGTSIRQSLDFNRPRETKQEKHWHARLIEEQVGKRNWSEAFKFTFVRNPWSRLYSYYIYKLRKNQLDKRGRQFDFESWARKRLEGHDARTPDKGILHYSPQSKWLESISGKIEVDYIGKFEKLESDFEELCDRIGLKGELKVSPYAPLRNEYKKVYNDKLKNFVGDFYREDIEKFDYKFDQI